MQGAQLVSLLTGFDTRLLHMFDELPLPSSTRLYRDYNNNILISKSDVARRDGI